MPASALHSPRPVLPASALRLALFLALLGAGCARPPFTQVWVRRFPRRIVAAAAAADLRRDGFSDLVLGVGGRLEAYYGTPRGLPQKPDWVWQPPWGGSVGDCVAVLERFDASPYPVLAATGVSLKGWRTVYLFHCGPKGLDPEPWETLRSPTRDGVFGERLVSVGDLYGDGYSCLAVSDYTYGHELGAVYVYRGGPKGPGPRPAWSAYGSRPGDWFGYSLCGPGDLDGDGFDDLVIGSKNCDGSCLIFLAGESAFRLVPPKDAALWRATGRVPEAGRLSVYYGSRQGLATKPGLVMEGSKPDEMFGYSLAPGGTDAQGRARLLVGSVGWNFRRGLVQLYGGGPRGAALKPLWGLGGKLSEEGLGDIVQWIPPVAPGQSGQVLVAGLAKGSAWLISRPEGPAQWKPLFSAPPVLDHLNLVLGWSKSFFGKDVREVYVEIPRMQEFRILKIN